jgi:hypothetical protein
VRGPASSPLTAKLAPSPPKTNGKRWWPRAFERPAIAEAPAVFPTRLWYRPSAIALVEPTDVGHAHASTTGGERAISATGPTMFGASPSNTGRRC